MYGQLLSFIIALLLFSLQQPGPQPFLPPLETTLLAVLVFLLYAFVCMDAYRRLGKSLLSESTLTLRYHRVQSRLSILAVLTLAVHIYVLNVKYYLELIPWVKQSLTLSGSLGLGIYLLHMAVVWFLSYPFYRRIYRSNISRPAFMSGHLSFSAAILIPWFLLSLLSDLSESLVLPAFFKTDAGQLVLLAAALGVFILFAPWLIVRLWRCRPIPGSPLRVELDRFCKQHRFKVGNLMLWPLFGGEMLTAGIMGVLPWCRYILITRSLLALLSPEELKAVLAHEMGHARRYHVVFFLLFFLALVSLTTSYENIYTYAVFGQPFLSQWASHSGILYSGLSSVLFIAPILIFAVIYFRYIFGFFLRNSERQADAYALRTIGHPYTLISSLQKIALYGGKIENLPSWHHFSIRQRIDFLETAYADKGTIARHNRKLYGSALLFAALAGVLIASSGTIESSKIVRDWRVESEIAYVRGKLTQRPDEPALLDAYGGLLLARGRYAEAESSLQSAHARAPRDAGITNNLAWLYATAPPPQFNPGAALELAREAAGLKPEPNILDTLAEACYANGLFSEALKVIDRAIEGKPANLDYFLQQKKKFEDALKRQEERQATAGQPPPGE